MAIAFYIPTSRVQMFQFLHIYIIHVCVCVSVSIHPTNHLEGCHKSNRNKKHMIPPFYKHTWLKRNGTGAGLETLLHLLQKEIA